MKRSQNTCPEWASLVKLGTWPQQHSVAGHLSGGCVSSLRAAHKAAKVALCFAPIKEKAEARPLYQEGLACQKRGCAVFWPRQAWGTQTVNALSKPQINPVFWDQKASSVGKWKIDEMPFPPICWLPCLLPSSWLSTPGWSSQGQFWRRILHIDKGALESPLRLWETLGFSTHQPWHLGPWCLGLTPETDWRGLDWGLEVEIT